MKSYTRYIITVLVLIFLASNTSAQETSAAKFESGVKSFTEGNYELALQVWNDIYNTGYRSANLNYNIGNAYFKMNNIPMAILFYERAYLINPADEDINYNLQIARSLIVDRFQEIPELFFVKWYKFMALFLSTNSWAKISIGSFVLCIVLISVYIYSSKYRTKVLGFWFAAMFLLLSISSLAFSVKNKSLVYKSNTAIVTNPVVSGKSSPDNSGTDLFLLHEGTKVYIEDEVGDWMEIRLSDGNKGWVPENSINII